jgi:hypothetical protein
MNEDFIQTGHPFGKKNARISRERYNLFKTAIMDALRQREMTHTELLAQVDKDLRGRFEGNMGWNVMVVKLDLEARKIVERSSSKPQRYRVKET